jgi:hypothetical protein
MARDGNKSTLTAYRSDVANLRKLARGSEGVADTLARVIAFASSRPDFKDFIKEPKPYLPCPHCSHPLKSIEFGVCPRCKGSLNDPKLVREALR